MNDLNKNLFFLHINKSAGTSVKKMLGEHYPVPNDKLPKTFIQIDPKYYNYNLNSHHVRLGEYSFKRALFAKKFLYEDFNSLYSFAFSRNPIDRVLSMFYYLYYKDGLKGHILRNIKSFRFYKEITFGVKKEFDIFLNYVYNIHIENRLKYPNFSPLDNHFATHTAPMFPDISENENIILTKIFKLDNINQALIEVFENCNIKKNPKIFKYNVRTKNSILKPSATQIKKIEKIYHKDFDLYESL